MENNKKNHLNNIELKNTNTTYNNLSETNSNNSNAIEIEENIASTSQENDETKSINIPELRHKASSFSKAKDRFSKFITSNSTLKRRLSKKSKTKNRIVTDNPQTLDKETQTENLFHQNNINTSDAIYSAIDDNISSKKSENQNNENNDNKHFSLIRKDDDSLHLEEIHFSNEDTYEYMGNCLNSVNIYKINELMKELSADVEYKGYYTPKNRSLRSPEKLKKLQKKADSKEDIYMSMEKIFHQVEICKMINIIGEMSCKNINIEKHNYYIKGIHLSANILDKIQFTLMNNNKDEKLSHCIDKNIELENNDEINEILKNIYFETQNTDYDSYLEFIINIQSTDIKKLKKNIFFFTEDYIYSLLSTNIKIYNDYENALKNMQFSLYAFDSKDAKNHAISKSNCYCYYADYYIVAINILVQDKQITKYYKIKGKHVISKTFDLFKENHIQNLIKNNSTDHGIKCIVIISLLFPYCADIQKLEIDEMQFELSIEVDDNNTSKNTLSKSSQDKNNITQQGKSNLDHSVLHPVKDSSQKNEFSFLKDDTSSIIEIDDLPTLIDDIDILEVTTPTLLIFNIFNASSN